MKTRILLCSALVLSGLSLFAQQPHWLGTITPEKEDTLVVYVDPGNVVLTPWDKTEIQVVERGLSESDRASIALTAEGNAVRLDYRGNRMRRGAFYVNLPLQWSIDAYASGHIQSSANWNGQLRLRSSSGNISLGDVAGSVSIECISGEVAVGRIDGSGLIVANNDLDTGVIQGDARLTNNNGDTYVKAVEGILNARAGDGDISVGAIKGSATLQTKAGEIDVRNVTGTATITTADGDIDLIDSSGLVVASSVTGEITLRKVSGGVDARTEDGDISAELISGSGSGSRFYSKEGDIVISFSPESRATVEVKVTDSDSITSDFTAARKEREGNWIKRTYELNGGGDSILIETPEGDVVIKKTSTTP